jgi:hypothetical protein
LGIARAKSERLAEIVNKCELLFADDYCRGTNDVLSGGRASYVKMTGRKKMARRQTYYMRRELL